MDMKTAEVPYAADAEVSLTFDELQVGKISYHSSELVLTPHIGSAHTIRKGVGAVPRHDSDKIQLFVGTGKESNP
jgi:hypothetical protein